MKKTLGVILALVLVLSFASAKTDDASSVPVLSSQLLVVPAPQEKPIDIDVCKTSDLQLTSSDVFQTLNKKKDWKDGAVVGLTVNKYITSQGSRFPDKISVCSRNVILWQNLNKYTPFGKTSVWLKTITNLDRSQIYQTKAASGDHAISLSRTAQTRYYGNTDDVMVYKIFEGNFTTYVLTLSSQSENLNFNKASFDEINYVRKKITGGKVI
jgi:hypothetical protein